MGEQYGADQIQILEGLEAVRNGRACTLEAHHPEDFIIWSMK